jgi:hypothetical protein
LSSKVKDTQPSEEEEPSSVMKSRNQTGKSPPSIIVGEGFHDKVAFTAVSTDAKTTDLTLSA